MSLRASRPTGPNQISPREFDFSFDIHVLQQLETINFKHKDFHRNNDNINRDSMIAWSVNACTFI